MVTDSEIIPLKSLYDFVIKDSENGALNANSPIGREFGKEVTELTK